MFGKKAKKEKACGSKKAKRANVEASTDSAKSCTSKNSSGKACSK